MSNKKNPGLTRRASGLMALEQRFMFDGAAVADALDTAVDLQILAPAAMAPSESLAQAEARAEQLVTDFLKRPDAREQLFALFKGDQTGEQATPEWQAAVDQLLAQAEQGDLNVRVELRSAAELQGAKGAFSATGTTGEATIYLNADWVATADSESVAIVLTEELGHYLDHAINGDADTAGDEGEVFAQFVVNGTQPLPVSFDLTGNDHAILSLDGQQVLAELASFNFVNAYEMVYDRNNNTTTLGVVNGAIDTDERWAAKEQNSHFFNASVSLGVVSISDGTNGQNFSGNDVSASTVIVGGTTYHGWISRPIKAGGVVRGFYFWTDTRFTTLALAQTDGNSDGDSTVLNNRGFLFVVDQTWFNAQIAAGTASVAINNSKDGNLGSITVANVGSSSDRVDSALNSVTSPVVNAAPTANADNATGAPNLALSTGVGNAALEQGINTNPNPDVVITASINGSGNVLFNDTDTNSDTLLVTTVSSKSTGTSATANSTGVNVVGQYGTLNIKSNGNWTYTPDNTNSTVNALLTGNLQEQFTYTASDGKGGSASATLTVQINGSNDAPVAADDYNIAKESTTTATTTTAVTGYTATGNVLPNDTDVDDGDVKTVNGIEIGGSATSTTITPVEGTASLTFTAVNNNIKTGDQFYVRISGTYFLVVKSDGTTPVKSSNQGGTTLDGVPSGYRNGSGTYVAFGTTVSSFFNTNNAVAFNGSNSASSTTFTFIPGSNEQSTIASAQSSSYTTISNLSGITGNVAVGMTVNGGTGVPAGTKISAITYTSGVLTSIRFDQALTSTSGGTFTFSNSSGAGQTLQGAHGTLTISSNGAYTYTPTTDNPHLSIGQSAVESFDYTMQDTAGVTSSAKLYITVYGSGTNDPVVANDNATAYESGVGRDASTPATLTSNNTAFSGVDPLTTTTAAGVLGNDTPGTGGAVASYTLADGTSLTTAGNSLAGTYGALSIAANGTYSFVVDNANTEVQALLPGRTLTETFFYKVTNTAGGVNYAKLNITIQGTNDLPVAVVDTASVSEDGFLNATGNVLINDTDVDVGDTKVVSRAGTSSANTTVTINTTSADGLSVTGSYGTLTLGADGTYAYALNNGSAAVQNLTHGQVVNDVFTYEVKDTNGATATTTLTISVTGANEAPVNRFNGTAISSTASTAVTTAVNTAIDFSGSKLLSITDADSNLSTITLEVEFGVLSFISSPSVVTLSASTGKSITISAGTQAELNAALALLRYTPDTNFYGTDFLSINSADANSARDIDGIAINIPTITTATVSEAALSSGSNNASTAEAFSGSVTLAPGQTVATQSGNFLNGSGGVIGNWLVNTDGTFTVTLTAASNATNSSFVYVVTDSFGNAINNTINVTITDDSPNASANTNSVNEGYTTTGNVLSNGTADTFGADGAKITSPVGGVIGFRSGSDTTTAATSNIGTEITGTYGKLTLNADGSYSYEANINAVSSASDDVFVYTIEDADGTRSTATLTITVNDYVVTGLSVNSVTVNEASPYVVFEVHGPANQNLVLALRNGTASGLGVDYGTPTSSNLNIEVSGDSGLNWVAYTNSTQLNANGSLLVRTPINNDTTYENSENFQLLASPISSAVAALPIYNVNYQAINFSNLQLLSGTDKAVGSVYKQSNAITIDGQAIEVRMEIVAKNNVSNFTIDENSSSPNRFQPQINSSSGSGSYVDYKFTFYKNGTTDQVALKNFVINPEDVDGIAADVREFVELSNFSSYQTGSGTLLTVTEETGAREGFTRFLGRETSLNGIVFENTASFIADYANPVADVGVRLGVTGSTSSVRLFSVSFGSAGGTFTTSSTLDPATAVGTATVLDNGTGTVFDANGIATASTPNDDRGITVSGLDDVSEGSNAIFTVTLPDGNTRATEISLALSNGSGASDAEADDYSSTFTAYYYVGATKTGLTITDGKITLPSGVTSFFVSVPTTQDTVLEGAENFSLTATITGGKNASDTSTILDDGTGRIYDDKGLNPAGPGNDDRGITVSGLDDVSEGSNAIFTVTLPDGNTRVTEISLALSNGSGASDAEADDYSSTSTAYYYVGATKTDLTITDGKITLPSGVTSFFVSVPTTQDTVLEGAENFSLTATITGGKNASDTSTILDDGTGRIYDDKGLNPAGPGNDDRGITVSGLDDVSEGSNAIFTVTLPGGNTRATEISLVLSNGSGANDAEANDYNSTFTAYYFVGDTKTDLTITDGKITLPSGVTSFFVSVPTTQDTDFEGAENFSLTATITGGNNASDTSTILDDGSGRIYDDKGLNPAGPGNDDRDLAVTGGSYNEASPRAVFTVSAEAGQVLSLDVQDAANTDKARTGDNEGGDATNGDALTNASIYYSLDGGATWSLYSTPITAGSVDVLVAVDITNEIDSFFEGEEQLKLEVASGSQTAFGYSSIMDDGTGIVTQTITAATTNVTGTNDPTVIKDDDRTITVTGLDDVSEGSNAIFTVTLPDGNTRATEISLALSNGSGASDAEANDYSSTFTAYYFVGDTKTNLTITDGKITLPAGVSSFFVSVPTTQDTDFEGAENFSLTATITGDKNGSDTSTILDDGSGRIYDDKGLNPAGPGNDDRDLAVTGGTYNEVSPRAVFTVSAEAGQVLTLDVQDAAGTGKEPTGANEGGDSLNGDALTNAPIYYSLDGGASWALYSGPITAGAVDVLVAVDITNETDTVFEGEEQLKLLVNAGQVTESSAYASIKDDGTGAITASITDASTNITSPANDLGGTKDDDRPTFSVSPVKVSEGGKAFFTVTRTGDSAVSQTVQVSTSLANGDTAETNDFEAVSNQTLTFAAGVNTQTFFVQTAADAVYEGDETFTVTLANATTGALISTTAGSAKGTIADDGTGTMFNDDGSVNTNAAKDNDKPQAVNDTLAVELGSMATANIITRNDTPAASSQLQVRSIAFVDAFGVERSFNLNALQNSTRTDYDKQVQLADGKLYISANGDTLYQHEGRRFLVTAIENRGVLEHNATGLADGWTTVALNNSVVVSLQDIADGRLRFTATQALTDPEATVAQIVEMDWRSDGFTYTMSDSGGLTPSSANVIYTVTGDETIYLAPVAPGADADVDGIASRVESVLANKARGIEGIQPKTYVLDMNNLVASSAPGQSSIGIGVAFDGDLNIDSPTVGDAYQNSVTTFSWINNTYFAASNLNPDLGNFQSIVTLVAENQSTTSGVPHPDVQLRGVTVLPLSAEQESGLRALVKFTPNWSPMGFSAEIRSDATGVNNIDTDPNREGNQWRFTVDISRTGETTETFMGFVKWIDQATINAYAVAGLPLTTLDGQPITREGWVDFTQRVPGGDGVTITNADGNILLLQYTITDNAFGDNDLRTGYINDPGMPVFLQREILVADSAEVDEGGVASFAVSLNAIRLLPTTIDLSLQDVSTDSANGVPLDYAAQMEAYYIDASGNRQTLEVVNGRVQLPGGVASFNVLVRSTQDAEFETNETFTLTASLAEGTTDSGSATIVDNDAPAELPVNPPAPPVLPQAPPAPPAPVEPPPPAPEPPPVATPEVPPPVIESPAPVLPPPTTPPAPAAPVAPPASAPANTPAPVVPTPPPAPVTPQSFSSTLAPLAPALVPADAPAPLGEAVTSSSGVPIPVSETAPPGLSIYQGITNQFIQSTDTTSKISLPFDAFIHSNKDAVIQLEAKQADDSPLPNWVRFDPATGVFEVTPPKDFKGKLDLKVLARDDDGREAVAIFQMFIGEQTTDRPQSRDSFTDKLRMVGNRPITLVRVVDASRPVAAPAPVREAPAIKAVPA